MEAKIEQDGDAVVLTTDIGHGLGLYTTRRFIVSHGNVLEDYGSAGWQQVCQRLGRLGHTLRCNGEDLIDVIRREFHDACGAA